MVNAPSGPDVAGSLRPANRGFVILLLAIAIGVLGGYGAVVFRLAIKSAQTLFYGDSQDILVFAHSLPPWMLVTMPALGGLLVGLLIHYGAPEAKGHGVPEVMEAIVLRGGLIRKRVAVVKILASAICIGSGGSVGREGPIVQIGSGVGSTIGQFARVTPLFRRTLVGCGAAAGIAATFNAPIAGVLFSLEILLGDFGLTSFSPVVLSSVTATIISRHYLGDFPAFLIPPYRVESLWEYGLYPLLGLLAGVVAVVFVTVLYKAEDVFDALAMPRLLKPVLGGLLLGGLFLYLPEVFGVGYGAINLALTNRLPGLLLLTLVLAKIAATSVTIGSGGSGGIFAPSLFVGAMTGGFFGWAAHYLLPGLTAGPGAYALVAMGALVAGTTHAPITAILIMFEMTNDYKIILPLMLSCIISTYVATVLKRGNIYTLKLLRRGVDLRQGVPQSILRTIPVRDRMVGAHDTIGDDAPVAAILRALRAGDEDCLYVIDAGERYIGCITLPTVRSLLGETPPDPPSLARDLVAEDTVAVTPGDSLLTALTLMGSHDLTRLPVVSRDGGRLLGVVHLKDVYEAYNEASATPPASGSSSPCPPGTPR